MNNLAEIKKDKKNKLNYGTLIFWLFFYFMNDILRVGNVQWANDKLVVVQSRDRLYNIGDSKAQRTSLWGYFKNF